MALMPPSRARRVLGKGLSPICNSITSLPCALSLRATARTSNAVSEVSPWANALRVAGVGLAMGALSLDDEVRARGRAAPYMVYRARPQSTNEKGLLLGGNGLGQGADDAGDDVAVDQL